MATSLPTYTGDITSLVPQSGVTLTDALVFGSKWGTGGVGTAATLTFAFPASTEVFDIRPGIAGNYNADDQLASVFAVRLAGFSAFSTPQQEAARLVLQRWAEVANLSFTEVAANSIDAGVLRFSNSAPPGMAANLWGFSWFPQDLAGAGDTWMNSAFLFPEGWAAGTQNFLTLLHEVGHALGLKHPHDGGFAGQPGWHPSAVILPFTGTDTLTSESTQTMVMAYNDIPGRSELNGLALQSDFAPTTPMRWDIAAIQYLYGANLAHNAGDTTYSFDGAARYNQTLWDGGGTDTIVATGTRAVEIDLRPAQWSKLGQPMSFSTRNADNSVNTAQPQFSDPYTVFIYDTVTIENASGSDGDDGLIGNSVANVLIGGGGNDTLLGGEGNDTLTGSAGNDQLLGGGGADTVVFAGNFADYRIGAGALSISAATTGTDLLRGVESLQFADRTVSVSGLAASLPSDPLVASQWYLANTGQRGAPGIDINLAPIAGRFTGSGVVVAVNDDGMDLEHADLLANYLLDRVYDAVRDTTGQGFGNDAPRSHGTVVGSIIGMVADNGIGGAGIAHGAKIVPGLTGTVDGANARLFLANLAAGVGVSTNSWGNDPAFAENFGASGSASDRAWGEALARAATEARGGLGMVIEVSGGNERGNRADPGLSNFNGNKFTISVGAVTHEGKATDYSSAGLGLLLTAPGGVAASENTAEDRGFGIASADVSGAAGYNKTAGTAGDYAFQNVGTSYSGPMVAAVAALMLEANPKLGLRDVASILSFTARKNDADSAGWVQQQGGREWNLGGMHYSRDYGYGLLDAAAAVRLAESWAGGSNTVANWLNVRGVSATAAGAVADGTAEAFVATASIDEAITIERLELELDIGMLLPSQLSATLTSPAGTTHLLFDRPLTRTLADGAPTGDETAWPGVFTMGIASFAGESSAGTWTLRLQDHVNGTTATFNSLALRAWGHALGPQNQYVFTDEFSGTHTLTDTAGSDTLNAAAMSAAVTISLAANAPANTLGSGTLTLAEGTVIENATGGAGNDRLSGNDAANVLRGNDGDDTLSGGAGFDLVAGGWGSDVLDGGDGIVDIVDFRGTLAVEADLLAGSAAQGNFSDTLAGFEALFGSSAADSIRGADRGVNARGETIRGGAGNDTIDGGNGTDVAEFGGLRAGYTVTRSGNSITVQDTDPSNGDDGSDALVNTERLLFGDTLLAFGTRAEEVARVAFALWTPGIAGSTFLFSIGFSFYDNGGYSFEQMCGAALTYWPDHRDPTAFATLLRRWVPAEAQTKSVDELVAIMNGAGGGEAGRIAALTAMANEPVMTAAVQASGVLVNGVVGTTAEIPGFGALFSLLPG